MCGIIGYTGKEESVSKLMHGLRCLEYRGYDSAGVAYFSPKGKLDVIKAKGKLTNLENLISKTDITSLCGIGHTRWATHGEPSDENSHPHGTANVRIVHNGIIENYAELKEDLISDGYVFESETDTEAAALVIDRYYKKEHDPIAALRMAERDFEGSYAIAALFSDFPGNIYVIRRDNPLLIGKAENGFFVASDITAFLSETKSFYRLDAGELCVVSSTGISFLDSHNKPMRKELETAVWDISAAEKGGFSHFMAKEIHEEPEAIVKTLHPRISGGMPDFSRENIDIKRLSTCRRLFIIGCGTAMHAGLFAKYMIEMLARMPVDVSIASEFRYADPILDATDTVLLISQSGETADTLAALRLAKERGAYTMAMVNTAGSTIAREADGVIYTLAGPEISVASTKAYTVQTSLLALIAIELAYSRGMLSAKATAEETNALSERLPRAIGDIISREDELKAAAELFKESESLFFIGRGVDYYIAMEGSLKLKEISYIHSEAYAAGELKHGTISLIEQNTPVIALSSSDTLRDKTASNIKEVKARGAAVFAVCSEDRDQKLASISDHIFSASLHGIDHYAPIACATVLQLLSYHVAKLRGCDIDRPRNLAKSVTVE